jgi:hypothetical protein
VTQVLIALAIAVVVIASATVLQRRRVASPPTQPHHEVPVQLDRSDFVRSDAPWLVVVFTSSTCHVCDDVARKAQVLESPSVAVQVCEFTSDRALHERYAIDAVPATVVADLDGVVRTSFLGPVTATDLWVAVAETRDPGSTPTSQGCQNHRHDEDQDDVRDDVRDDDRDDASRT